MLKHASTLHLVLAGLFVVPALSHQDDQAPVGLTEQLDATVASIEYLAGLRARIQAGEPGAVGALMNATEPPKLAPQQRDERLVQLRESVSRLRLSLDRLLVGDRASTGTTSGMPGAGAPNAAPGTGAAMRPGDSLSAIQSMSAGNAPTVGLDATLRSELAHTVGPLDTVDPASRRRGDESLAIEDEGFSADQVRQGKLLVRAGRHAEAVELLEKFDDELEARYWLAHAYRKLGREAEALEIYRAIAADENAGVFARYATHDLDFLEWKREFELRKGARGKK